MFKINKDTKTLEMVSETSFKEIHCKERSDLQEWIVSNPLILGEELLIIQKEFDGFSDTHERLDLLALDKQGRVVVIENKLDDTGKDVVWQAVKYASYCYRLTATEIKEMFEKYIAKYNLGFNAEQKIVDFLGADDFENVELNKDNAQRIILVSREFRKEVLSATDWLNTFAINMACIKIIPYKDGNNLYLDAEQILPQKETKEFTLRLANKSKEQQQQQTTLLKSEELRIIFWKEFLPIFNQKSKLFENITVSENTKNHWLGAASGMYGGASYNFLICKSYCGVELGLAGNSRDENKAVFDYLYSKREEIENNFGSTLEWERIDSGCMSRIVLRNNDLSLYDEDKWTEIMSFLETSMINLESCFKNYKEEVKKVINKLKK